jgi:hypothetical protein
MPSSPSNEIFKLPSICLALDLSSQPELFLHPELFLQVTQLNQEAINITNYMLNNMKMLRLERGFSPTSPRVPPRLMSTLTRAPLAFSCAATSSPALTLRQVKITLAPAPDSTLTVSMPRPAVPPVTMAVRPDRSTPLRACSPVVLDPNLPPILPIQIY